MPLNPYEPPRSKLFPPRGATVGDHIATFVGVITCVVVAFYFVASLLD